MKVEFRYPIIFRHSPNARQRERHHIHTRTAIVDVAEMASENAPVVFSWSADGRERSSSYRLIEGAVCGRVTVASSRLACRSSLDYPTCSMVSRAQETLRTIAARTGPVLIVPPEGFLDPSNWSHIVELPHNANQDDIAEWDGCFSDCVSGITLVEGELWRAVPDPLVVVYRNTSGWQTSVSHEVSFSQDLHKFHFPADRWEEAQDFCRQLARNTNRPVFAGGFVYDPSWVPMRDTDFAELREIASRQVSHINRNTSARAKIKTIGLGQIRPKLTWNDLPTELFNIYVALRNVLDVPAALFGEAEASTAVEYFERLLRLSDLPGLSWLALQPDAVRAHIEKWAARPIEFPLQLRTAGIRP